MHAGQYTPVMTKPCETENDSSTAKARSILRPKSCFHRIYGGTKSTNKHATCLRITEERGKRVRRGSTGHGRGTSSVLRRCGSMSFSMSNLIEKLNARDKDECYMAVGEMHDLAADFDWDKTKAQRTKWSSECTEVQRSTYCSLLTD